MTSLQLLWFILIGVLFSGFFFLEGFDFGVGMLIKSFAKNDAERDVVIRSIGPHWDGNEVWLITAGGAMFASFPMWYATLFSGYYLVLFCILAALIFRESPLNSGLTWKLSVGGPSGNGPVRLVVSVPPFSSGCYLHP